MAPLYDSAHGGRVDDLIGPDEVAFHLELTPPQLKILHAALRSMRDDFGHDQPEVHRIIHELLAKLPDEASIRDRSRSSVGPPAARLAARRLPRLRAEVRERPRARRPSGRA